MTVDTPDVMGRFDGVWEFRQSLTSESDRGCALLAASYLDSELEELLRGYLVDDSQAVDKLFRPDGALGSFAARIELAYLVGLVGASVRRDLHLIRKVRNDFGHSPKPIAFHDQAIADRCRAFQESNLEADAPPRARFTNVVMASTAAIHAQLYSVRHRAKAGDVPIDDEWRRRSRQEIQEFIESLLEADDSDGKAQD